MFLSLQFYTSYDLVRQFIDDHCAFISGSYISLRLLKQLVFVTGFIIQASTPFYYKQTLMLMNDSTVPYITVYIEEDSIVIDMYSRLFILPAVFIVTLFLLANLFITFWRQLNSFIYSFKFLPYEPLCCAPFRI